MKRNAAISLFLSLLASATFTMMISATSAFAGDMCDDLWFSRNSIMNDNGYCFGTNLGKANFDNSDCHTKKPKLSKQEQRLVKELQEFERNEECRVNTKKEDLDIDNLAQRRRLTVQPINDGLGSNCIGFLGEGPIALRAGHDEDSAVLGHIHKGDNLNFEHISMDEDWSFISSIARDGEYLDVLGWVYKLPQECEDFAG
jgi:hypothetical protein